MGRRGGGMRGGSGRIGGGLSGGSGRIGGNRSGVRSPAPRMPAARGPAPRMGVPRGRAGSFGAGMATGMLLGGRRRRSMWGWGGGWGWGRPRHTTVVMPGGGMGPGPGGGRGGGGCGCFTMILVAFLIIIGIAILGQLLNFGAPGGTGFMPNQQVTRSTVRREALPGNAADSSVPFIVDNNLWVPNRTVAETGMRNFHNATGVRPILYITNNLNGVAPFDLTESQLNNYARALYPELTGTNQAHVLFLFVVSGDEYAMYVQPGAAANTVIDTEAENILLDYMQHFWYTDGDNSRMVSRAFDNAGTRIMNVHRSPWINVLIAASVALILFLLYTWWKAKQDQKNLEAEQTERILNQDLSEFGNTGSDKASQLAELYEDDEDNQN